MNKAKLQSDHDRLRLAEAELDMRCGGKGSGVPGPCATSKGKKGADVKLKAAKDKLDKINAKVKAAKEKLDKLKADQKVAKADVAKLKSGVEKKVTSADKEAGKAADRVREVEDKYVAQAHKEADKIDKIEPGGDKSDHNPIDLSKMRADVKEAMGKASPHKAAKALGHAKKYKNNDEAAKAIAKRIEDRVGAIVRAVL